MADHRTVLVTGAARGIGFAVAHRFAVEGDALCIVDKNETLLSESKEKLKKAGAACVDAFCLDLTDSSSIEKMFAELAKKPADVLVNCAGISTSRLMLDIPEKEWDLVFSINAKASFLMAQKAARQMIDASVRNGRIINISSQASKIAERGNGAYCASKAAVNMITQVLGLELAEYGITVNAICPGYVRSELLVQVFNERGPLEGMTSAEYEKLLTDKVPIGRLAIPEDIARLVFFLAGEDAGYITGVTHTIAGGVTLI